MSAPRAEASFERNLEDRVLRIADFLLAAALIVFTFPLMMFVALAIKLESPGPVLYRQPRVGQDGRQFTPLSFRTTPPVAEQGWNPSARETRIGEFLQYTRIAHLPQLVNVLRGDMTLVGRVSATRRAARWTAWAIFALASGALFRTAGSVFEFLD